MYAKQGETLRKKAELNKKKNQKRNSAQMMMPPQEEYPPNNQQNPKKKISLSFITVFLAICVVFSNAQNDTSELKWYSMPPDEIKLNIFQSPNKINPNSNPDYIEWVFIRDAFRYDYSEDNDTYVKLVDYFAPETDNYYKDKLDFAGLFIGCAVISFVCIIIYLIIRFVKKGCMGPKNKKGEEAYDKHKWSLVIIGGTIAFVSLIVTMAYSSRQ